MTEKDSSPPAPYGEVWISVTDRMPETEDQVLVYSTYKDIRQDCWKMRREAPVSFSSVTVEIGMMWDDHEFEEITHWMPLPAPPAPRCTCYVLPHADDCGLFLGITQDGSRVYAEESASQCAPSEIRASVGETPRTDAQVKATARTIELIGCGSDGGMGAVEAVTAEFARTLERENAQLKADLALYKELAASRRPIRQGDPI